METPRPKTSPPLRVIAGEPVATPSRAGPGAQRCPCCDAPGTLRGGNWSCGDHGFFAVATITEIASAQAGGR